MAPWMQTRPHWQLEPRSGIHRSGNSACLHYITDSGGGMKSISVNVYEELERGAEQEILSRLEKGYRADSQTAVLSHFVR